MPKNFSYASWSVASMDSSSEVIFFSMRRSMAVSWRFCCSVSRLMFSVTSAESTTPRTKL